MSRKTKNPVHQNKKWMTTLVPQNLVQNWGKVYGELAIMYERRLPE